MASVIWAVGCNRNIVVYTVACTVVQSCWLRAKFLPMISFEQLYPQQHFDLDHSLIPNHSNDVRMRLGSSLGHTVFTCLVLFNNPFLFHDCDIALQRSAWLSPISTTFTHFISSLLLLSHPSFSLSLLPRLLSLLPLSSLLSLPSSLLLAPLSYLPDPLYFILSISNFLSPTTHYPASRFADDRSEDVDIEDAIESLQVNEQFSFQSHTQNTISPPMCPGNEVI